VVTVSWASDLEQMLPWLIALATFAVAIGIGAILVSGDAAEESPQTGSGGEASVPASRATDGMALRGVLEMFPRFLRRSESLSQVA
jgi:hypothetical protein